VVEPERGATDVGRVSDQIGIGTRASTPQITRTHMRHPASANAPRTANTGTERPAADPAQRVEPVRARSTTRTAAT
jgi:hypothetical protein